MTHDEMEIPVSTGSNAHGLTEGYGHATITYVPAATWTPCSKRRGASCRHHSAVSTSNPAPSIRRNPEFLNELGCTTTGYLHNEEANAQSFTADGWFRTGDLG